MTLKLNTYTGTRINEKLLRAKQEAEARKYLQFRQTLINKLWSDVENGIINEDNAFMVDNIICDYIEEPEMMLSLVAQACPAYNEKFVQYVYEGLRA